MNMVSPELAQEYKIKHQWLNMSEDDAYDYIFQLGLRATDLSNPLPRAVPPSQIPWDERDCIR
jgi:hypothetical protein